MKFPVFIIAMCLGTMLPLQAQVVLTVAAYPAVDDIVRAALPEWKKRHPNVEVKVVGRDFSDHHTAMTTALSASSGLPDVMTIEYGYLGRFAQSGGLEDLSKPPYQADTYQSRFVSYAWAQARVDVHGQVAMPTDIGPGVMFYRQDLMLKAGIDVKQLSQSWDGFLASARQLKTRTGAYMVAHARDVKDVMIRAHLAPGEGIYYDAQGQSVVGTSPRFKQAFEMALAIRQQGLDAKVNAWSNDWSESLRRGQVGTQMMGAWLGGHLQNWLAPQTAKMWRSGPLPQGAALSWGGTFYAIPKKSGQKVLAWDLIQHLTLQVTQQQQAFEKFNAFPALLEAQKGSFFEQEIGFLGGQKARLEWRESAQRIQATRVFRNDPIAEELVNAELDLVLTRGKPIDVALADAHRMVQRRAQR